MLTPDPNSTRVRDFSLSDFRNTDNIDITHHYHHHNHHLLHRLVPLDPGHRVPEASLQPPPLLHLLPVQFILADLLENFNSKSLSKLISILNAAILLVILELSLSLLGSPALLLPLLSASLLAESAPPPVPLIHNSPVIRQLNIF